MQYRVRVLPKAAQDRNEIIRALRELSPPLGKRYFALFAKELRSLAQFPNRCPPAHDSELAARGYRFLVVRNYLVFFTVERDTVTIRRIFDGRRPLPTAEEFS